MDLAQAWNFKGLSYLNAAANKQDEKMLRKAADSFREVLKLFPNNDRVRYNLGNTLIRLNEDAAGIRELHEYIEKSDDDELIKEARRIIGNPRRARENYAPEYSLETTDGRVITSDDLLGKVVLFNFWINLDWSGVDRIVSDLKKMAEKHPNEPLVIVNLSLGFSGTPGPIWDDYFEEKNIHWPVVIRGSRKIAEKFGAKPSYTFIVIDHEGIIRYRRAFDPFSSDIVSSISGVINDSLKDLAKSKE